ncbi:PREDICTED: D-inositol 3-phosphate glycosyltransferase-like isoform X2 [Acropora digitifera]|nr:PREDICTED: D-inositol 3-phosphate glycosyltransferase-like isoform X2 [Acropora digitifera]XP_015747751.1 PREDICTED: D-inositol 3-phosphate glycosyltransferase-like isoform X2 [Acropora digitifera]XP_015747752.1 PREDICTED: D-inositol 3-phosphate glycosyltransferase-like isoform X2 [Acropora digitifera]XP_015747753.1 PREDICTED: D-inositol 3-phosphate glycosyltransferase-like isoform X2 [Acropora digitifera]
MSEEEVSKEADAVQNPQRQTLKITLLASEWKSLAGGLSTLNRELAINLSKIRNVSVSLLVPEGACTDEDKREAKRSGISIIEAKKCVGLDPLVWLSHPPEDHKIDVIVGHGVKLGSQVQLIKRHAQFQNCKWVHVVHTAPENLSKYKDYDNPNLRGEEKHWNEIDLCKSADLVVPVGPKIAKAYHSYLQECKRDEDFFELIPGLFEREFGDLPAKQKPKEEEDDFIVLLCGRGDKEDFELKGYNIAVEAFANKELKGKHYSLLFVGSPEGKQDEVRERLLKYGITEEQLTVREFVKRRERMKELFCEVDMVIMPSKAEGFGLIALEALSAGLPILVGSNSGFARAIKNIPWGKYRIVGDAGDPGKWAEAIEDVRDRHKVVLDESKSLKENYGKEYSWKKQCEEFVDRLLKMVYEKKLSEEGNKSSPVNSKIPIKKRI